MKTAWAKASVIGAACAAALLSGGAAYAQSGGNLSGTWAFHTADYSQSPEYGVRLGGVAEFRRAGSGRYAIRLLAQEVATQGQQYSETWARQTCVGSVNGDQLTITCEVDRTSSEAYAPDNFQLTIQDDGSLSGHLASAASSAAVFRKLD